MRPFAMERWQSTYENRVTHNLSESGVHPLTLSELLDLAGEPPPLDMRLGYGQSNGSEQLRTRIAGLYRTADASNVVVTTGGAEANFATAWELVRPGDEVILITPTYMQVYGLAEGFGARVREVPLRETLDWQPDPDDIRATVSARTRLVALTNPNNPTGAVLRPETRRAIIDAAAAAGAWIMADEVYVGAELSGAETASFWGDYDRVVATGSLSKAYGLPGLRIGWVVAPPELAERVWARSDYTTIAPAIVSDHLASLALRTDVRDGLLSRTRMILGHALPSLQRWARAVGGLHWRPPDAGAICYFRYDHEIPSTLLAERLLREQDVLIVPGAHFDMKHFIRIGYGLPPEPLEAALGRVEAVLRTI